MHRIKSILGSLISVFSLVYFLFAIVGWVQGGSLATDVLTCVCLGTCHIAVGAWLVLGAVREQRAEARRIEEVLRTIVASRGGRIRVEDLAWYANITEDDAREYLEKRRLTDVIFHLGGRNGKETYYFGQKYWNN